MSVIKIGDINNPQFTFAVDAFIKVEGKKHTDLIADELVIDTFSPSVRYEFNNIINLPYGTPVWYVRENETLRFYLEQIERVSNDVYALICVSIIGLFDSQYHEGGVYTGERTVDLIADIFGGTVGTASGGYYPITGGVEDIEVSVAVGDVKTYGYLPYDTKRNNLHQILFATGASLTRSDENIRFVFLDSLTAQTIPRERIYIGNSVKYDATATGVEITEHSFQWVYNAEPSEQYNNLDAYAEPADHTLVVFSAPIKVDTAVADGLTVHEIGQNYAIVSGNGTLSAIPYVHLTRRVLRELDTSAPRNIKSVTDCTLISAMNSENVIERLFAFYTQAFVQNASVVAEDESTGRQYSFRNEFDEDVSGILSEMSFNETSIVKADGTFILGYTPSYFGNNYNNHLLLTGSGTWYVPDSVRQSEMPYIRFAIVGGGNGGNGGEGGEAGRGSYDSTGHQSWTGNGGGKGGKGGKAGAAGTAGKVLSVTKLDVSNVHHITYSCGTGGSGGIAGRGGEDGDEPIAAGVGGIGSATTLQLFNNNSVLIGSYSSANGYLLPSGIIDLVQNNVFALNGIDGVDGANGGSGGAAAIGASGEDGEDVEFNGVRYTGGDGSISEYAKTGQSLEAYCGGGGGGGAAVGMSAAKSVWRPKTQYSYPNQTREAYSERGAAAANAYVLGGQGGDGANAVKLSTTPVSYGQGGNGGHGGGGGGSGGAQNWDAGNGSFNSSIRDGWPGNGGNGTSGWAGQNGCIFLYY